MFHFVRFVSALTIALFVATAAWSETISPAEAAQHVSEQVTVSGVVTQVSVSSKGTIFLNFGGRYPNQVFYAVVFSKNAALFRGLRDLEGRSVAINGVVELYKGKAQIILSSPDQISLR